MSDSPQAQRPREPHPATRFAPFGLSALSGGGAFGIGLPWFVAVAAVLVVLLGSLFVLVARRRPVEHLRMAVDRLSLRRGEKIGVRVEVLDASRAGARIDVGLACDVRYVVRDHRGGDGPSRTTRRDRAYDGWLQVPSAAGMHEVYLEVPRDQPFSHDGKVLDFTWKVIVRDVAPQRVDSVIETDILVLP